MSDPNTNGTRGVPKRKLIEVALPLEAINRESAREKSIRHGHPSTLHLWWARRPLAAARAVLFAQLVDDPSSRPDHFPTEEAQRAERGRLHGIIERLVVWENIRDEALLDEAHREILSSTNGNPPPILDPFAGGGTIPLEAQRLGLEARASDLNPVAVLINKAMIEIPPKFAGRPPVYPGAAGERMQWPGTTGLAADIRAYGDWLRDEAERRVGAHYPRATLPDGDQATVIAWIWARTVTCPNPTCGVEMPLVRSWWLGKKRGKEAWIKPFTVPDKDHPSGRRVQFHIEHSAGGPPIDATVSGRRGATCVTCGAAVDSDYLRAEGAARRMGAALMAIVAEGRRQRVYLDPVEEHVRAADVPHPTDVPDGTLSAHPQYMGVPRYGMTEVADLFTNRQLLTMTTFSDLVLAARELALSHALASGLPAGARLEAGGSGAEAYADAVATYLAAALSRSLNKSTAICSWDSSPKMEAVRGLFARQAISMSWDFAEANVFGTSSGNYVEDVEWVARALENLPVAARVIGTAKQADAAVVAGDAALISTDPPYYDNVPYADLSDFFYVWLRRSLRTVYPELLSTMLVPKADELVANTLRHHGTDGAREFFEQGFRQVFARARCAAVGDYPVTVYYAFRQSDADEDGTASTGWETLLDGMIRGGWAVTATWPIRSELANRTRSLGANALASSIVLALRPRADDAPTTDRRGLIKALQDELPDALRKLQQGAIAPVDLPQAAIGPGMAVFSRYSRVIENDGSTMRVRSALARINEILDQVLNEQEGDFDTATRFAIAWYRQHGYAQGNFGEADNMARARNTSVETVVREGVLTSAAGKVKLLSPSEYPGSYDVLSDDRVGVWEVLHHLIATVERDGIGPGGEFLRQVESRADLAIDLELVKELAFLLFSIGEKAGSTQDAIAFNSIATSWPEIMQAARESPALTGQQMGLDLDEGG